jgi:hypothetical protein
VNESAKVVLATKTQQKRYRGAIFAYCSIVDVRASNVPVTHRIPAMKGTFGLGLIAVFGLGLCAAWTGFLGYWLIRLVELLF